MGRIRYLAAILLGIVLVAVPRPAHATLGMCTLVGTVYNVDGTVAANGTVGFRLPSTQTFSADSVQTSLEPVVLDSGGNLPAGTQVPLGARIFIQVGRDKPVAVTVTNNPANCPLAFGTLVGSGAASPPIPSTVVTAINTTNNIPGITDTAVNPAGAGPATLTLSDGYPITFGSSTGATDLAGAGLSPLFTQVGNGTNGVVLQDETSATASGTALGQMAWGSTGTSATDKRAVVLDPRLNAASATNPTGRLDFYLADGSGNPLGTVGTMLQLFPPNNGNVASFLGAGNVASSLSLANTTSGTASQSFFESSSSAGDTFLGTKSAGWTGGDVPADYSFVEADGGTNGLYLVSDATHGDEGIHFAANSQIAAGNLQMTEDASANFFLTMPDQFQFLRNFNGAAQVEVSNTTAGANSQAEFEVINGNGLVGNFSATGASSTFGAPYTANMAYIQGLTGNGLLVNASGPIHFGASGQGGVGTLDLTEDGSGDMFFNNSNTATTRFTGGNTTFSTLQVINTQNSTNDILEVYPQNVTVGLGFWYGGIRMIGTNGNNSMDLDSQANGVISLQSASPSTAFTQSFSAIGTVNNHHIYSALNGGTLPTISGSCGTNPVIRAGSTDNAGQIAWSNNSTIASGCTINFGAAWGATPECTCSAISAIGGTGAVACGTNASTTQLAFSVQASFTAASGQINWICMGIDNDVSG